MLAVVGEEAAAGRVAEALAAAGAAVETGPPDAAVASRADVVVAVGAAGLVDAVGAGVEAPVLPVGDDLALPSLAAGDVPDAVPWLDAGDYETREHPLLGVEVAGEAAGRALLDAMLVRSQPGRISEYGVDSGDERSRFRADGVVVATPAGSRGYARRVGGPRLAAEAGAVAVVPVGPFALGADVLVVDPAGGVRLSVERDEGTVSLLLDGREVRALSGRATVDLSPDGGLEAVVPPSGDRQDRRGG